MPGPVSDSNPGPRDDAPYIPPWCYPGGPKLCPCGHHEGYHNDAGKCLHANHFDKCGCTGLPAACKSRLPGDP
jgi:hypothetical protein